MFTHALNSGVAVHAGKSKSCLLWVFKSSTLINFVKVKHLLSGRIGNAVAEKIILKKTKWLRYKKAKFKTIQKHTKYLDSRGLRVSGEDR